MRNWSPFAVSVEKVIKEFCSGGIQMDLTVTVPGQTYGEIFVPFNVFHCPSQIESIYKY